MVINYLNSAEPARKMVTEIQAAGGRAVAVQADVGRTDEIEKLFDATFSNFGRLDILVNNAALPLYKSLVEITEAEYDRIFAVNVKGTFFACQQAARRMADGGRIINVSSSTTVMMLATYSAYVATKGAVEQITRSLAKELGPRGITVNTISPGGTDTELFGLNKTAEDKKRFAQMAAFGRIAEPQDIADVVSLLASDDADWITGQNLRANGGVI